MKQENIDKAASIFGSYAELARRLNVDPQNITHWKNRGVPPDKCRSIQDVTNGQVTVHDLRPDIFGPAPEEARTP